jgi:hypothetical protein
MRLVKINLIALVALAFTAMSASAYEISLTTDYTGATLNASDYVTVQVWLDTELESNITLIEIGVTFNPALLGYARNLSAIGGSPPIFPGYPNYILYGAGVGRGGPTYMAPRVPIPGGFTYDPPKTIIPTQVNTGWVEASLGGTTATATNQLIATLVFHVKPVGADGTSPITPTLTLGGTIFQLADFSNPPVTLTGSFDVMVAPEPGVLAASFAALVTLGGLRAYRRRKA